jgi:nitrate/nitrite transport system ATP-binding protein
MVAGMPLALTAGYDGRDPLPIVTALILSRNGNAITFDRDLFDQGVRSLADFKALIDQTSDRVHSLAVVHPASMQNLMLRYWLASGGIDPDQDVNLVVIPPPQMVANLISNNIDGYCVGEPWNTRAVNEREGVVLTTDLEIWAGHPEKILGVREDWANQYPETHNALVKALLEACTYCDDRRNREEILEWLCRPEYVGVAPEHLRPGFIDAYDRGMGAEPKMHLRYNQFYVDQSNCPGRAEGLWILTQLARWGIIPFPRNWIEVLERNRRLDLYGRAARELDLPDIEPDRKPFALFDEKVFNPDDPISYLNSFEIGRPLQVEEILLDQPAVTA